jgi:hypothetical protein
MRSITALGDGFYDEVRPAQRDDWKPFRTEDRRHPRDVPKERSNGQ